MWPALAGDAVGKQSAKAGPLQEVGTVLEAAEQGSSHEGLSALSKSLGRKALLEHKDKVWEWTSQIGAWLPTVCKLVQLVTRRHAGREDVYGSVLGPPAEDVCTQDPLQQ